MSYNVLSVRECTLVCWWITLRRTSPYQSPHTRGSRRTRARAGAGRPLASRRSSRAVGRDGRRTPCVFARWRAPEVALKDLAPRVLVVEVEHPAAATDALHQAAARGRIPVLLVGPARLRERLLHAGARHGARAFMIPKSAPGLPPRLSRCRTADPRRTDLYRSPAVTS